MNPPRNLRTQVAVLATSLDCTGSWEQMTLQSVSYTHLDVYKRQVTMGFKRSENGHKTTEFLYIDSLVPGIQFGLMCFAGLLYDQF